MATQQLRKPKTAPADPGSPSDDDLRATIGHNIRRLREAKGLRKSDLAKACAVDPIRINKLETGQIAPGGALLLRLARALDTTAEALASEDGEISTTPKKKKRPLASK